MQFSEVIWVSKPTVRVHRPKGIEGIEKAIALQAVEGYCKANGLSIAKLGHQIFDVFDDSAAFLAPTGIKPDGLRNDLATQPVPVLILEGKNGDLVIRQTEHTAEYIAN